MKDAEFFARLRHVFVKLNAGIMASVVIVVKNSNNPNIIDLYKKFTLQHITSIDEAIAQFNSMANYCNAQQLETLGQKIDTLNNGKSRLESIVKETDSIKAKHAMTAYFMSVNKDKPYS